MKSEGAEREEWEDEKDEPLEPDSGWTRSGLGNCRQGSAHLLL